MGPHPRKRLLELADRLRSTADPDLEREVAFVNDLAQGRAPKRKTDRRDARVETPPAPRPAMRVHHPNPLSNLWAPLAQAALGFIAGFLATTLLQCLAARVRSAPMRRLLFTLALVIPILVLATWLGHHGATQFVRAAAYEAEMEGFAEAKNTEEIAAVRTRSIAEIFGCSLLLLVAFAIVRVRRKAPPR
jgi:hypothetical protein